MTRDSDHPDHDARKDALTATVEDARDIARSRRDDGWEAVVVPAGDTAPVPRVDDIDDPWGFVHVVPGNHADEVATAVDAGSFPRYDVYRRSVGNDVFFVTELLDSDRRITILIAGTYAVAEADALYRQATSEGTIRTHLKRLDGTHLGSFEHEDVEKFFPDEMETLAGRS